MADMDDKKKPAYRDRSRININEDYEVRHWTKTLGVTREDLARAIEKVGPTAAAVRKELGKVASN
jgi:hypothetical protein